MGLLSFAGDLIGGVLGARSAENAKDANVAMSAADREWQKEMATQGIRYRVADARSAGISPLAAMGAQLIQPSPTAIGVSSDNSWANAASSMGQNLERAFNATSTGPDRMHLLQLENAQLQNDYLRAQIAASNVATRNQAGVPPGLPSPSYNRGAGLEEVVPSKRTSSMRANSAREAAISPATKSFINEDGSVSVWPSADAKQSIEDSLYEYEHMYRNRLRPYLLEHGRSFRRAWEKTWWNPWKGTYK